MTELTARQGRFVDEYLIDLNATQAAKRAGYSAANADKIGPRLVGERKVAARIAELQAQRSEKAEASEAWVITQLTEIVKRAMTAIPVLDDAGKPTGVYAYQGNVANRALELLGRHRGMFTERREITGANGGPVEHRVRVVWEGGPR